MIDEPIGNTDADGGDADAFVPDLHRAALAHDAAAAAACLAGGADADLTNPARRTAMHLAAGQGYADVVRCLLAGGADPDPADAHWVIPLMLAATRANLAAAEHLLAAGANPLAFDDAGAGPPHWAAAAGSWAAVELLLAGGAGAIGGTFRGETFRGETFRGETFRGETFRGETFRGETPLHLAAQAGPGDDALRTVRLLLAAGADPTADDGGGYTPLALAESNGHAAAAELMRDHDANG